MRVFENRHELNIKRKPLIILAALIVLYGALIGVLFGINANFGKITDLPATENGVSDFEGIDRDRLTAMTLAGEWEFFYNRWIITDNDGGENDGFISIPGKWTGKILPDGQKASRKGYASYRLTIKNLTDEQEIIAFIDNATIAVRIFINGELASVAGTVSKDPKISKSGQNEFVEGRFAVDGVAEIVLETGYTTSGGLTHAPSIKPATDSESWMFQELLVMTLLGIVFGAFAVFSVISFGFARCDGKVTSALFIGMLLLHFFFSKDVTKSISLYGYGAVCIPHLISGIATVIVFSLYILTLSDSLKKKFCAPYFVVLGCLIIVFGILINSLYEIIPAVLFLASSLAPLFFLLCRRSIRTGYKIAFIVIYFLTVCIFTIEIADGCGLLVFGTENIFSIILPVIIFAQCIISFLSLSEKNRRLLKVGRLESELNESKRQELLLRIKPHFVFNSLTAIQAVYHKNLEEGDRAVKSFSDYLRSKIDADTKELVPFDAELLNVNNYFELENIRADNALTLLLDTAETDFTVPMLSLQPLVENAIKHGRIQDTDGGFVSLSTEKRDGFIIIRVADNGRGFDTDEPSDGVGLKNVKERFERLLSAEMTINSAPLKGTEIIIKIPVDNGEKI